MLVGIGLKEENVLISDDVLRLKCERHQVSEAGAPLESTRSLVPIKIELGQSGQTIERPLDRIHRCVLAFDRLRWLHCWGIQNIHVASGALTARLSSCQQNLPTLGVGNDAEPAAPITNRVDWNVA